MSSPSSKNTNEMPITNARAYPKATFLALPKPAQLNGNHNFWTGLMIVNQSTGQPLNKPTIQIPAFEPFTGRCCRIYSIRVPTKINLKWMKELAKFVNAPFKVGQRACLLVVIAATLLMSTVVSWYFYQNVLI